MEEINIDSNKDDIKTFKLHHNGACVLLSDLLEDYEEVKNIFEKKDDKNFFSDKIIIPLNEGIYDIFVTEKYLNKFGKKVKDITIFNEIYDYEVNNLGFENWINYNSISIDAGSFMFISDNILENKTEFDIFLEKWMACEFKGNILKHKYLNKTIAFGTTSGYGDGIYNVSIYKDNDNIVGIYISFIDDETDVMSGQITNNFIGGYTNENIESTSESESSEEESSEEESSEEESNNSYTKYDE